MQIDNGDTKSKIKIRRALVTDSDIVLDLFAGNGEMFDNCYSNCKKYTGIEIKKEIIRDNVVTSDNLSYLDNNGIGDATFVDIDAYGSCAKQFIKVLENCKSYSLKIVFTDGGKIDAQRRQSLVKELAHTDNVDPSEKLFCAYYVYDDVLKRFFAKTCAKNMYHITSFYMTHKDGNQVLYGAMTIEATRQIETS